MPENFKEIVDIPNDPQQDNEDISTKSSCASCIRTNVLTLSTIGGVIAGIILGIILKETVGGFTAREIMYINFPGDVYLRMLKSLILPLIVSSLISAMAGLDISLSGKVAARAIFYYLTTTFAAVVLGIILVATIKPGLGHNGESSNGNKVEVRNVTTVDTLLDLVKNMFPPNIVQACIEQYRTKLTAPESNPAETDLFKWDISEETTDGMNIIGLVVVACVVGVALGQLGDECRTLTNFFANLTALSMKITTWVIWLSPFGIMFLITSKILEIDDFGEMINQLGMYFITVLVGLILQGFVVLPLIYIVMTRKSPIRFIMNMSQAMATAFGTSSSSASLPITIKCLEEKNGVDPRIARFALPIGATINMDGTALYEAVAAIFIAQVRGIDISIGHYITISITATAAAIGAAGIPQAGLVTMVMVLSTVGLPIEDVSLIIAVDWLLDRCRTVINVLGDAFGAAIVYHLSYKQLKVHGKNNDTQITEF